MIALGNDYYIEPYSGGYKVGKRILSTTEIKNKKTGEVSRVERVVIEHPSYITSLEGAITVAFNLMVKEKLSKHRKDIGLDKVVSDIQAVYAQLAELLAPLKKLDDIGRKLID